MNSLSTTTSLLAHSLSWSLLYSLWQGLLIYITLYVILKAFQNISSRVKHYLSFAAFTALFLWFADTWIIEYQKLKGVTVYISQTTADTGVTTTYPVTVTSGGQAQNSALLHYLPHLPRIEQYVPVIMLLYSLGLTLMMFRFLINIIKLKNLKKQGITDCDPELADFVAHWQKQFGITRKVQLFISKHVNVPMMLGVIKPVILLPFATINHLTAEQVEAILLHELAHIKRHDYLLNIFQVIVETLLFFNPFIWLISAIIRREREHCCDDLVISCAESPLPYAKALAILENNRINSGNLALAASGQKNQLFNRIKRIMEMKKSNISYSQLTITLVAIIAITFSIAMFTFTPSFAQKAKDDQNTGTKKKTVYKSKTITIDSNGKKTVTEHTSSSPENADMKDHDDDDNLDIKISVNGDDSKKIKAKVIMKNCDKDDKKGKNKVVKEIVINTDDVADAIATIDFKGMNKELANASKEIDAIDWDEINAEIHKELANLDKQLNNGKLHKEISLEIKKELEHTREALEQTRKEMEKTSSAMAIAMSGTNHAIAVSGNDYETMLDKMEKDGLINRSTKYKVEKDDDGLFINGVKQPDNVYQKYSPYFKNNNIVIKGNKDTLNINIMNDK